MSKYFSIIKTGYSAGVYGCSNEYFTLITVNSKGEGNSIRFRGLYGSEDRVKEAIQHKGYKEIYAWGNYGQLKGQARLDANKFSKGELETIDYIKANY